MEGGGAGSVADTLDLYQALALFRFMDMHPLARELTWRKISITEVSTIILKSVHFIIMIPN